MADESSSIRFKKGGVEFELVGSAADVGKAWDQLSGVVVDALKDAPAEASEEHEPAGESPAPRKKSTRKRTARKSTASAPAKGADRSEIRTKLLESDLDDFPQVGDSPIARYAAYAVLDWAKKTHGIDGLTAPEMQEFFQQRFSIPNTPQAYRQAFKGKGRAREFVKSGSPQVFKLMKDGKKALDKYVKGIESGATADDAAAAADKEAEKK